MTGQELPIGWNGEHGLSEPKAKDTPFLVERCDHHGFRVRSTRGVLWAFFDAQRDAAIFGRRLEAYALGYSVIEGRDTSN